MPEATLQMVRIRSEQKVRFLGTTAAGEMDTVKDWLKALAIHTGPTKLEADSASEFLAKVLRRLAYFYPGDDVSGQPAASAGSKDMPAGSPTRGPAALRALFHAMKERFDADPTGAHTSMNDIRPLKTFAWVFDEAEVAETRQWLRSIYAIETSAGTGDLRLEDVPDSHKLAVVKAGTGRASACGAKSSVPVTRKASAKKAKIDDKQSEMMRFFVAAPKASASSSGA